MSRDERGCYYRDTKKIFPIFYRKRKCTTDADTWPPTPSINSPTSATLHSTQFYYIPRFPEFIGLNIRLKTNIIPPH